MRKSLQMLAVFLMLALPLGAQASGTDPAPLKLSADENRLISLSEDASSIIVNNPDRVSVSLDSPRLLMLTPLKPGATSMIVMGRSGNVIMQKDIIVTNVRAKYMRVRRNCATGDTACEAASYSYCPDGCFDVTAVQQNGAENAAHAPNAPPTHERIKGGECDGEPPECLIGAADSCPPGYKKVAVSGNPHSTQGWTCQW